MDLSIPKWIPLVPEQQVEQCSTATCAAPHGQPNNQVLPQPGNSWTNLEVQDVQEIRSRHVGASPLAGCHQERLTQVTMNLDKWVKL